MTEQKTQRRARIDSVIKAIERGQYDDKLADIQNAVKKRQDHKKEELLARVQEVYGYEYTISPKRGSITYSNPNIAVNADQTVGEAPQVPDADIPEGAATDIEARSPLIGPYNPS